MMDQYAVPGVLQEYWSGLRAIKRADSCEQKKARTEYTNAYLQKLESLWMGGEQTPAPDVAEALAFVLTDVARSALDRANYEESREVLNRALERAQQSGRLQAVFVVMHSLAEFSIETGNLSEAADWLQKSILYSTEIWPYNFLSTIERLAFVWSAEPVTVHRAEAVSSWWASIQPISRDALISLYSCQIELGRQEYVERVKDQAVTGIQSAIEAAIAAIVLGDMPRAQMAIEDGKNYSSDSDVLVKETLDWIAREIDVSSLNG
jgi:hypothetical protein